MATGYSMSALVDKIDTNSLQLYNQTELIPDFHLPLKNNLLTSQGNGYPVTIDVSAAQDGSVMVPIPNLTQARFVRSGKGTYTDPATGLLKESQNNEPRFERKGILIEGQSTNMLRNSGAQGGSGTTMPPWWYVDQDLGNTISPSEISDYVHNGAQLTKFRIHGRTSTVVNRLLISPNRQIPVIAGKTYSFSVYAFLLNDAKPIGSGTRMNLDLSWLASDGSFIKNNMSFKLLLDGRLSYVATAPANAARIRVRLDFEGQAGSVLPDTDYDFTVAVGSAQLEELPFVTSYIPTNEEPVTRPSDILKFYFEFPSTNYTVAMTIDGMNVNPPNNSLLLQSNSISSLYPINWQLDDTNMNVYFGSNSSIGANVDYQDGLQVIRAMDGRSVDCWSNNHQSVNYATNRNNGYSGEVYIGSRNGQGAIYGHVQDLKIWNRILTDQDITGLN